MIKSPRTDRNIHEHKKKEEKGMATVKHKFRGTATILGRDGDHIRIKYDRDGYETELVMPDSFTFGIFEIDQELQREVDLVLAAKKEAENLAREKRNEVLAQAVAAKTAGVKTHRTPKAPAKVKMRGAVERDFEKYLIASGYSVQTPSGLPSTVAEYINAVDSILDDEGLSWGDLKSHITRLVSLYGTGGPKEANGRKRNYIYINALYRFADFVNNATP